MAVDIQFNADQALAKLGELVAKHGPQAIDLAAQVVQINAVSNLVTGLIAALFAAGFFVAFCELAGRWVIADRAWNAWLKDPRAGLTVEPGYGLNYLFTGLLTGVAAFAATVTALVCLANAWTWVGVFNPKLALAHQVLAKFAGV